LYAGCGSARVGRRLVSIAHRIVGLKTMSYMRASSAGDFSGIG
jgi:hypothetical protein